MAAAVSLTSHTCREILPDPHTQAHTQSPQKLLRHILKVLNVGNIREGKQYLYFQNTITDDLSMQLVDCVCSKAARLTGISAMDGSETLQCSDDAVFSIEPDSPKSSEEKEADKWYKCFSFA